MINGDFESEYIIYGDEDSKTITLIIDSPIMLTSNDYIRELEYFLMTIKEKGSAFTINTSDECEGLN